MNNDSRPRVSFEHLVSKVARAEDALELREQRLVERYRRLNDTWRKGWTPVRIIAVGLASGFLIGRAEPLRALTGARMLQMVSALSGLFASAQAKFAAEQAEEAADTAEEVASGEAAGPVAQAEQLSPGARMSETRDPAHSTQPRAAEAATEMSER
jgi:hypothetical protein